MKKILFILSINIFYANAEIINFNEMQIMLRNKIMTYKDAQKYNLWETIPKNTEFTINQQNNYVPDLRNHLSVTGEYKNYNDDSLIFSQELSNALLKYQENNNLKNTGYLNIETITQLNEPINKTIYNLNKNLERLKTYNYSGDYILVNLPFYQLNIIYQDKSIYQMPIIIGKSKTQSCTLNSEITSIVFNPSWYVPSSIAKKEMIPKLENNPDYFEKHNIHITNNEHQDIDINNIFSEDYSNLKFVQYPGNNNALGKVKFIFKNDCGIYLHDTNQHNLFSKDLKGLSHGCIRLSNPDILSQYLLKYNNFNDDEINDYLQLKNTKTINLKKPVDIYIIYLNMYVNSNNEVLSRKDIYNKN